MAVLNKRVEDCILGIIKEFKRNPFIIHFNPNSIYIKLLIKTMEKHSEDYDIDWDSRD